VRGETVYNAALCFYPQRFRNRFRSEMIQLFRDSCKHGGFAFWLLIFRDLVLSIPREWHREMQREDCELDYTGLADTISICCVVGTLLLSWGWMGSTVVLDLNASGGAGNAGSFLLVAVVVCALAALVGVLSALVAARKGRIETLCSELSNYEKTTARYLR
jgi:phosphatidylglycerophosphate synthase